MSQHMDFRESNHEEPSAYSTGYQETPGYNSYATGFGLFGAGQKLSGSAPMSQKPTAGQRLALAIVSLALLIPLAGIALGTLGGFGGLLGLGLVCLAIIVVNIVFNIRT